MSLAMRLKAYAPNGASLGILPAPQSVQAAMPFGDVGGVEVAYPKAAPRSTALATPCEIAVEVSYDDGATWLEPNDARYLRLVRKGDTVETPELRTYSGPAYVWRLAKARVLPEGALNAEGKRPFLTKNVGAIMRTLTNEAQARGALSGMDFTTFSEDFDSNGAPWPSVVTLYYEPGLDYLTVLLNLHAQGLVDFTMVGRSLRLYVGDTVMAGASGATLQRGRDLTEAPYTGTMEGLANFVYLAGDNGLSFSRTNGAATAPWGRWESFISQGGVSDTGTMTVLTDSALELSAAERVENTYGLEFAAARSLPFRDYGLGKDVKVRDGEGVPVSLRCRQITLTRDEKGHVAGNVVLNDRFLENEVRQARRVQGITGGSTADGGTGARPAPDKPDTLAPKAPTGLTYDSDAYLDDEGKVWATVTLNWAAPTQNTDNTALTDLAGYEVYWRPLGSTTWTLATITEAATATTGGYFPNTDLQFAVRALDNDGNRSPFSAALGVVTEDDGTVPTRPSKANVSPYLGQLLIRWDGQIDSTGDGVGDGTPPTDFDRVEVYGNMWSDSFEDVNTVLWDTLTSRDGGATVQTGLTYGAAYRVWLVMVDRSGNRSLPSFIAYGFPVKAAAGDIDTITANQIIAGVMSAAITISGRIATALTGQRVELNNTGLKAYDAAGTNTVSINTDGSATITGTYQTAVSGRRLEISAGALGNGWGEDGQHSLKFYPAALSSGWTPAGMLPYVATSGANQGNALILQSSQNTVAPFTGTSLFLGMDSVTLSMTHPTAGSAAITLYGSGTSAQIDIGTSAKSVNIGNGGTGAGVNIATGSGSFIVTSNAGNMTLYDRDGGLGFHLSKDGTSSYARSTTIYDRLYGSGATVVMTTLGTLGRLTSLERNKVNIDRTWGDRDGVLDALRGLRATSFYDRGNAERFAEWLDLPETVRSLEYDAEQPRAILGLIAEDVQRLGLDDLLEYDADGELTGVAYQRLAVALLPWLHALESRLDALESAA